MVGNNVPTLFQPVPTKHFEMHIKKRNIIKESSSTESSLLLNVWKLLAKHSKHGKGCNYDVVANTYRSLSFDIKSWDSGGMCVLSVEVERGFNV